jgi:acyl-CoA synthetase (AMP-forming)/AMP-acid ligase II
MIFRSPYPAVDVPRTPFHELILHRATKRENLPVFIDTEAERTFTYGELARSARGTAAGLSRHGMGKGDVLVLMLPNVPEFATALLGAWMVGGVVTTINPMCTAEEIATQLLDAGAKYLVTIPACAQKAIEAASLAPQREMFVLGSAPGLTSFAELLQSGGDQDSPTVEVDADKDTALILYSSGTTGKPKGVLLTHSSLTASVLAAETAFPFGLEGSVSLGLLPFFHAGGLVSLLLRCLCVGGTLALMRRFEAESLLRMIQQYNIEVAPLVPPIVVALARYPALEGFDLSSLRYATCGSAPLGAAMQEEFERRLGIPIVQAYGTTEAGSVTHGGIAIVGSGKRGTVGPCVPNVECKVVDPLSGSELGPDEQGEVCVRGRQLMKGYLNNDSATAESIDADGWYHTGDVGYADEDGYLYIVDRIKELIKCNAYQVAPAELEAILVTHPAIADAAVISSPDEERGEVPKAFVVAREPLTETAVIDFVAARVAPYKRIRCVEFIDALPKSPAGKLLRRVLRDREAARVNAANQRR